MSKGYTINYFINTVSNTTTRQIKSKGLARVVSPRFGYSSIKYTALDFWLNGYTGAIASGSYGFNKLGKTPRARILKALKARKNGNFDALVRNTLVY